LEVEDEWDEEGGLGILVGGGAKDKLRDRRWWCIVVKVYVEDGIYSHG
jgi:hypothetical protein